MSNVLQLPVQETTVTANEVTVVKATGAASISLRGASKLVGCNLSTLQEALSTPTGLREKRLYKLLTSKGFDPTGFRGLGGGGGLGLDFGGEG